MVGFIFSFGWGVYEKVRMLHCSASVSNERNLLLPHQPGRVVQQYFQSDTLCHLPDTFSHMPYQWYPDKILAGWFLFFWRSRSAAWRYCSTAPRIASGTIAPGNPGLLAIYRINVVEADGGCPDKPYVASFQQFPVTDCPCADNRGICVFNDLRCEGFSRQMNHFIRQLFDDFADVGILLSTITFIFVQIIGLQSCIFPDWVYVNFERLSVVYLWNRIILFFIIHCLKFVVMTFTELCRPIFRAGYQWLS